MTKYYGFQCYDKDNNFMGWLYTYNNDKDLAFTKEEFNWCKRWKTERGVKKYFDDYNQRWRLRSRGGYLKVEVMPEISADPYKHQQRWQEAHPEVVQQSKAKYDAENPVWSIRLKKEIRAWLEEERWSDENGKAEGNTELLNRKLEKLIKLEQHGF